MQSASPNPTVLIDGSPLNVSQELLASLAEKSGGVLPSWLRPTRQSKHHYARALRAIAKRQKRETTPAQRKNTANQRRAAIRKAAMRRGA